MKAVNILMYFFIFFLKQTSAEYLDINCYKKFHDMNLEKYYSDRFRVIHVPPGDEKNPPIFDMYQGQNYHSPYRLLRYEHDGLTYWKLVKIHFDDTNPINILFDQYNSMMKNSPTHRVEKNTQILGYFTDENNDGMPDHAYDCLNNGTKIDINVRCSDFVDIVSKLLADLKIEESDCSNIGEFLEFMDQFVSKQVKADRPPLKFTLSTHPSVEIAYQTFEVKRPKGAVLILTGYSEFYTKYHEMIEGLNAQGLNVYAMDWPGQGNSGRLLQNRSIGHIDSFKTHHTALNDFLKILGDQYGIKKDNLTVFAHSMGGNIVLNHILQEDSKPFGGLVLSAPMISPNTHLGDWINQKHLFKGLKTILGEKPSFNPYDSYFEDYILRDLLNFDAIPKRGRDGYMTRNIMSSCKRYAMLSYYVSMNPHLKIGDPSYNWLYEAAKESEKLMKKAQECSSKKGGCPLPPTTVVLSRGADSVGGDFAVDNRKSERVLSYLGKGTHVLHTEQLHHQNGHLNIMNLPDTLHQVSDSSDTALNTLVESIVSTSESVNKSDH